MMQEESAAQYVAKLKAKLIADRNARMAAAKGFTLVCTSLPFHLPFSLPYSILPHFLEPIISPFNVSLIEFPLSLSLNSLPYYILPHFLEPIISPLYVSLM